jgi:hypothetical protein
MCIVIIIDALKSIETPFLAILDSLEFTKAYNLGSQRAFPSKLNVSFSIISFKLKKNIFFNNKL